MIKKIINRKYSWICTHQRKTATPMFLEPIFYQKLIKLPLKEIFLDKSPKGLMKFMEKSGPTALDRDSYKNRKKTWDMSNPIK